MQPLTQRAYIGLGSNLGKPLYYLRQAHQALSQLPHTRVVCSSSVYLSRPQGPQDQPDYLNAVLCLDTQLAPLALLDVLQTIEHANDRVRKRRWGERTLDLDLLLYAQQQIALPRLTVPHPQLTQRNFVLYPLYEIAPDLAIQGTPLAQLCQQQGQHGLQRLSLPYPG